MYCSLLRIQFTSSTQIKPSHMAFGCTINILYLLTYLLTNAAVFTDDALVAYERLYGSVLRHLCNAVVWIAELVHVKKKLEVS